MNNTFGLYNTLGNLVSIQKSYIWLLNPKECPSSIACEFFFSISVFILPLGERKGNDEFFRSEKIQLSSALDKSSVGCMYRIPIPRSPQLESESCIVARPVVDLTDIGNSELLLCLDGGIDKGGMGESSSKSVSSSQSIACSSESTEVDPEN